MSGLNKLMMDSSKSRIVCSLQAEEGKEEWKEGERERGGEGGEHKEATVLRGREQKPRKTIATVHTITHMVVGSDSKKTAG